MVKQKQAQINKLIFQTPIAWVKSNENRFSIAMENGGIKMQLRMWENGGWKNLYLIWKNSNNRN